MALDIYIVGEEFPNWEGKSSFFFADVDPYEWESLFFKDLGIKTYLELVETGATPESYEKYISKQYVKLQEDFPMISRIKEYYDDAFFSKDDIKKLIQEINLLERFVKYQPSKNFLSQLSNACEAAQKNSAGIILIAD
jgi:hypothetical protein